MGLRRRPVLHVQPAGGADGGDRAARPTRCRAVLAAGTGGGGHEPGAVRFADLVEEAEQVRGDRGDGVPAALLEPPGDRQRRALFFAYGVFRGRGSPSRAWAKLRASRVMTAASLTGRPVSRSPRSGRRQLSARVLPTAPGASASSRSKFAFYKRRPARPRPAPPARGATHGQAARAPDSAELRAAEKRRLFRSPSSAPETRNPFVSRIIRASPAAATGSARGCGWGGCRGTSRNPAGPCAARLRAPGVGCAEDADAPVDARIDRHAARSGEPVDEPLELPGRPRGRRLVEQARREAGAPRSPPEGNASRSSSGSGRAAAWPATRPLSPRATAGSWLPESRSSPTHPTAPATPPVERLSSRPWSSRSSLNVSEL